MALTLKISTTEGPYYRPVQLTCTVFSLASLVETVREASEDHADAIGVYDENAPVAIWVREPDFDCDADGFYELATNHHFQGYRRYNRLDLDNNQFWHHISYFFGTSSK